MQKLKLHISLKMTKFAHARTKRKRLLVFIDNFDSFTYNIVQCFLMLECTIKVIRAQSLSAADCLALNPSHLIIGPGPGSPSQAYLSKELLSIAPATLPILGICLGHQLIAEHFGGRVMRAPIPMHGKTSPIYHQNQGIYYNVPQAFTATRYHSLIVQEDSLPQELLVSARTENNEVMGLLHTERPIESVQFHPESILSENGLTLFQNFLDQSCCH